MSQLVLTADTIQFVQAGTATELSDVLSDITELKASAEAATALETRVTAVESGAAEAATRLELLDNFTAVVANDVRGHRGMIEAMKVQQERNT